MGKKNGEKPRRKDKPRNDKPGKDKPPKVPSWYQNTGNWGPEGIHYDDSQWSDSGVIYNPNQIAKLKKLGLLEDPAAARQAYKAWNQQVQAGNDRLRNDPFIGNNPDTWQGAYLATGLPSTPQNMTQLHDLMAQGMTYTQAVQQMGQQPTQIPNPGLGGTQVPMNGSKPPIGTLGAPGMPGQGNTPPPSGWQGAPVIGSPQVAQPGPMGGFKLPPDALQAAPQAHGLMAGLTGTPNTGVYDGTGAGGHLPGLLRQPPYNPNTTGKPVAPNQWIPGTTPNPVGPGGPRADAAMMGGRRRPRNPGFTPYNARG